MRYCIILFGTFFLLESSASFCQESSKIFELRGRIDALENSLIDILPTNGKKDSLSADIVEINSIIGKNKGKAVDVLNALSKKQYKLISALYICGYNSYNSKGNFLIYYLKKEYIEK